MILICSNTKNKKSVNKNRTKNGVKDVRGERGILVTSIFLKGGMNEICTNNSKYMLRVSRDVKEIFNKRSEKVYTGNTR